MISKLFPCCIIYLWLLGSLSAEEELSINSITAFQSLQIREEIVWTGTYKEEITRQSFQQERLFYWETRVLVLEQRQEGAVLALYNKMVPVENEPDDRNRNETNEIDRERHKLLDQKHFSNRLKNQKTQLNRDNNLLLRSMPKSSIFLSAIHLFLLSNQGELTEIKKEEWLQNNHLEFVIGSVGKITNLPQKETSMFLNRNEFKMGSVGGWYCRQDNLPFWHYRLVGKENWHGSFYPILTGEQQSIHWHLSFSPTTSSWKKTIKIWLNPAGYAQKGENVTEVRDANSGDINFKATLNYEQKQISHLTQIGHKDRFEEIRQAFILEKRLHQAVPKVGKSTKPFDEWIKSYEKYIENYSFRNDLPYRDTLSAMRYQVELFRKGESTEKLIPEEGGIPTIGLAINQIAPDFLAYSWNLHRYYRLHQNLGHPVLLIYVKANADSTTRILQFGQNLQNKFGDSVRVLAVTIGPESKLISEIENMKITYPLLKDCQVRQAHTIESTPQMVVLDSKGYVRKIFLGWGSETPFIVQKEILSWK